MGRAVCAPEHRHPRGKGGRALTDASRRSAVTPPRAGIVRLRATVARCVRAVAMSADAIADRRCRRASSCAGTRRSTGCSDDAFAFAHPAAQARVLREGSRRYWRRRRGAVDASAHRSARRRRQSSRTTRSRIRAARSARASCFPVGALSAGGTDDEDLPRAAGHVLLSAAARRLPRVAPALARIRALLRAGHHRDAAAVAGAAARPIQPARRRAAVADARRWRARAPARRSPVAATTPLRDGAARR